jgi:hypothetical protein
VKIPRILNRKSGNVPQAGIEPPGRFCVGNKNFLNENPDFFLLDYAYPGYR